MPRDSDLYDCFVSYARRDNRDGWISAFITELLAEHRKFSGGRTLTCFFDKEDIRSLDDWQHRIQHGLAASRLFLAFISPNYFASEWCRREWRLWIDTEIAKHILSAGAAPIYIVEVPGLIGRDALSEQQVAGKIAALCELPTPHGEFIESAALLVHHLRRRQLSVVEPFYTGGLDALRRDDLRKVLAALARDLDERAERVRKAAESESTVPPYNKRFSGRLDELLALREQLKDDRSGVISGIHGLGGIGKTELAFTYAHAFASAYPGGRFLIPCEGSTNLRDAAFHLGSLFPGIDDEARKQPETYFAAIAAALRERLDRLGHILLLLDNVTDPALLSAQQTDILTALGPHLHLLATTRLLPPKGGQWLTLGELPEADALEVLEKHRAFADDAERDAARCIVGRLGGFALAVELVAAWLKEHPTVTCAAFLERLGLEDLDALDALAEDTDTELRRHNHERRVRAILAPALAGLTAAQRRALEYAALLPPDQVPLPWLRTLVSNDFPELAAAPRPGHEDPWQTLTRTLFKLALITRAEGETTEPRIIRVHRLVQDILRRDLSPEQINERQDAINKLVGRQLTALKHTTLWPEARREVEFMEVCANFWAEMHHPAAWLLLQQVAARWCDLAEWTRAEPLVFRSLAMTENSFGPEQAPGIAIRINTLAQLWKATNRLAAAESLMRLVLPIYEKSFGPEHIEVAASLDNLALLLRDTNRPDEAEPLFRRALAIYEKSLWPEHHNVATSLNNLAALLYVTNRLAEAEALYRRALAIDEKSLGPEHPNVATSLNNLALLLSDTNRLAEAEPLSRRMLVIFLKSEFRTGHKHPHFDTAAENYVRLLKQMGWEQEKIDEQIQKIIQNVEIGGRGGEKAR